MYAKDHSAAAKQAQANANYFGIAYAVFKDTSGSWRTERLTSAPKDNFTVEIYHPQPKQ